MKALKTLSIILLVGGFLLLAFAYISKIQHWPDVVRGMYSGPVIMIVGVILFIIRIVKTNVR